jgi:hypothetical protein
MIAGNPPSVRPVTIDRWRTRTFTLRGAYVFNALDRGVPRLCPFGDVRRLCVEAGVPSPVPFIDVGLSLLDCRGFAPDTIKL